MDNSKGGDTEPLIEKQNIESRLNAGIKLGNEVLDQTERFVKVIGSAANNSLIVLGLECAIASACTLLVNSITPVQWIVGIIPKFHLFNIIIYLVLCALVQFGSALFRITPWNFLMFLIHFVIKVSFLIFYGVQYPSYRLDVYYFFIVFGIAYCWVLVKNKEAAQKAGQDVNQEVDISIKGNFFKVAFIMAILAEYLCLMANAGIGPMIWIPVAGILYTFFLLLVVQKFDQVEYLRQGRNSIFLGSAQIDADLVFFCPLAWRHIQEEKQLEQQQEQQEQQEYQEQQQQQQQQDDEKVIKIEEEQQKDELQQA